MIPIKYDVYNLKDKFGNRTTLRVPAGDHNHKLLWGGKHKIENIQKNIKLSEAKSKNINLS